MTETKQNKLRIDKWLWAARFFKTRSLASTAIQGGKVHLNKQRIKPSKEVCVGQEVTIRTGDTERTVIILVLSAHRGPATVAQTLYVETEASIAQRIAQQAQRKFVHTPHEGGRPTKRDRRLIHQFTNKI